MPGPPTKYRIMLAMNTVPEVMIVRDKRLIDAQVDHVGRQVGALAADLANAVEDHDRVVDRKTDDRQQRGHDRQADLERIDQQRLHVRRQVGAQRQKPRRQS